MTLIVGPGSKDGPDGAGEKNGMEARVDRRSRSQVREGGDGHEDAQRDPLGFGVPNRIEKP